MPGLRNLGNTCFAATVLQALASSPEVVLAITQGQAEVVPHGFARASAELILRLADERSTEKRNKEVITPSGWIEQLRATHRSIGFQQQDAEEVFLILSSALFSRDKRYGWGSSHSFQPASSSSSLGLAEIAELAEASHPLSTPTSIAIPRFSPDPALHDPRVLPRCGVAGAGGGQHAPARGGSWSGVLLRAQPHAAGQPLMEQSQQQAASHPLMGLLSSSLRCSVCNGQQECTVDAFCDLSLSIPPHRSLPRGVALEDCLRLWAHSELVEGARCEGCLLRAAVRILHERKKTLDGIPMAAARKRELLAAIDADIGMMEAAAPGPSPSVLALPEGVRQRCQQVVADREAGRVHRRLRVARPPRVLCLHLRRVLPTLAGFSKDRTPVAFAPSLDLSPFLERFHQEGEGEGLDGGTGARRARYVLVAVVVHMGDAYGGHYICYCKTRGPGGEDGGGGRGGWRWLQYNDEHVREVSMVEVLRCEPYLLFYEQAP